MNKHTPGPWRVTQGSGCYHAISENGAFSTGCISFDGQGRANAHLIAAAPDLLALVRALRADPSAYWWHKAADDLIGKIEQAGRDE